MLASVSRAESFKFVPTLPGASSSGICPLCAVTRGEFRRSAAQQDRRRAGQPLEGDLDLGVGVDGVDGSSETVATSPRKSVGSRSRLWTVPIRSPLNRTAEPGPKPETGCSNRMR